MADWTQFERDCGNAAYGEFLIRAIAEAYDIDPREPDPVRLIRKYAYKFTNCGAFVQFDESGILVGTIVEGSDAEYSERLDLAGVNEADDPDDELRKRYFAALDRCEQFAEENFGLDESI